MQTTTRNQLNILRTTWLDGPNIWTYRPCIEILVDIQGFEDRPSNTLEGFNARLLKWLPGLTEHRCGIGEPGGFVSRLHDGTYAAHILEHIVIELHSMAGQPVGFGKARMTSQTGIYKMVFRTTDRRVGMACLETGMRLFHAAVDGSEFDIQAEVKRLKSVVDRNALGPSTNHIVEAAYARRIPFFRLNDGNLVQIGHSRAQQRIWTAETSKTSAIAEGIAGDKALCKEVLAQVGVPVPYGAAAASPDEAWEVAQDIGLPVVVKPVDGNHGRGVSLELSSEKDIRDAWVIAEKEGSEVIVEQFIKGVEHRLLIINYELAAAARGEETWIEGDGQQTVDQLIASQVNTDPRRGEEEEFPLEFIELDKNPPVLLEIQRQGFQRNSVVPAGKRVLIQRNSNAAEDVTDLVHPEIARMAGLAAQVVGLDIAGIDLVCEHIDRPLSGQSIAIVEVNAGPGLLMHLKPSKGKPRELGKHIIQSLIPEGQNGRVPLITYSGGDEITDFGPAFSELIQSHGEHVGLACEKGLWMGGKLVAKEPSANWQAGRNCLINRDLSAVIMQVRAATILSQGLPFDRSSLAVITSLGQYENLREWDILNQEQLFNVIRTVVDLVLKTGQAVINADEVALLPLKDLCDGEVIWISQQAGNPIVKDHVSQGGRAVTFANSRIEFLGSDSAEHAPIDLKTKASNPLLLLSLAAAGWAMNIPHGLLRTFIRTKN